MRGSMFTGGASDNFEREDNDFYATHPNTTRLFLTKFKEDGFDLKGDVLEPACGQGHMSKVIQEYYPENYILSTDLIYRGYGIGEIDFLEYDYGVKFDTIITNPPFKYARDFIEKGLKISKKYVIMLMKIQFLESIGRKEFLEDSPLRYVYVHSSRQACMMKGLELNPNNGKPWSSPMMLAWYVFEIGYEGEPVIRWI